MQIASRIFLSPAQRKMLQDGWAVWVFHKIAVPPPGTRDPFEYTRPEVLDDRLAALQAAGFRAATLDDLLKEPDQGVNRFVITFDDGYSNVVKHALPVLQRQRVPAIEFLVARKLGGLNDWDIAKGDVAEKLMDRAEVKDWLAAGNAIGSHSLTHPNLRKIPEATAREEIHASKKLLEDTFGVPINHFCYPFGSYDERIRNLVGEAGYQTACTVKFGVNPAGTVPLELNRIPTMSKSEGLQKALHRVGRKVRNER